MTPGTDIVRRGKGNDLPVEIDILETDESTPETEENIIETKENILGNIATDMMKKKERGKTPKRPRKENKKSQNATCVKQVSFSSHFF